MRIDPMFTSGGYLQANSRMMKENVLSNMQFNQNAQALVVQGVKALHETENNFMAAVVSSQATDAAKRIGVNVDVFA